MKVSVYDFALVQEQWLPVSIKLTMQLSLTK